MESPSELGRSVLHVMNKIPKGPCIKQGPLEHHLRNEKLPFLSTKCMSQTGDQTATDATDAATETKRCPSRHRRTSGVRTPFFSQSYHIHMGQRKNITRYNKPYRSASGEQSAQVCLWGCPDVHSAWNRRNMSDLSSAQSFHHGRQSHPAQRTSGRSLCAACIG